MAVPQSIFANPHYLAVWLEASKKTIQANPGDQQALNVHFALNELHKLFGSQSDSNLDSMQKRPQIFRYFEEAAKKGDPRAQFFLGLCYADGFGCEKNTDLGNNLIGLAAVWRQCDLALDYAHFRLGIAYSYGDRASGIKADLRTGVSYLLTAGLIATQVLDYVREHVRLQELHLAQRQHVKPLTPNGLVPTRNRPMLVSA